MNSNPEINHEIPCNEKNKNEEESKDLLILVRHGERCDKVGLIPTFHKHDPELTEKGKQQGFEIGTILSDYLSQNFPQNKNIFIISSPFARTIQTSKKLIKGLNSKNDINKLNFENTIHINYHFTEFIDKNFTTFDYTKFLILKNQFDKLEAELEDTRLIPINDADGIMNNGYETTDSCSARMINGIKSLLIEDQKNFTFKNLNGNKNVFIIVSHAEPINQANIQMKYPGEFGWSFIKYANAIIYDINYENAERNTSFDFIQSIYPSQ